MSGALSTLRGAVFRALILGGLLLGAACDRETTSCPECPLVPLEGRVLAGGKPLAASVRATEVTSGNRTQTVTDSIGGYRMDVAPGEYFLTGMSDSLGLHFGRGRDGVTVPAGEAVAFQVGSAGNPAGPYDVRFGLLDVSLRTPPDLDSTQVAFRAIGQGTFAFSELKPQSQAFQIRLPAFPGLPFRLSLYFDDRALWLPPALQEDQAQVFTIPADSVVQFATALPAPARLAGTITGSWQRMGLTPLVAPRVEACLADSSVLTGTAVAADGSFSMSCYVPEMVKVRVTIAGVLRWIGGRSFREATPESLRLGQTTTVSVVENGILCHFDPAGIIPLAPTIALVDGSGNTLLSDTWTQGGLSAPIPNLDPGTYYLNIRPTAFGSEAWLSQWFDGRDSLRVATPIVVQPGGEVTEIRLHLVRGATLEGIYLPRRGLPGGGRIIVAPAGDQAAEQPASYAREVTGGFEILGVPDGPYRLGAVPLDTVNVPIIWYPGTADWDSAAVISVQNHLDIDHLDWSDHAPPASAEPMGTPDPVAGRRQTTRKFTKRAAGAVR